MWEKLQWIVNTFQQSVIKAARLWSQMADMTVRFHAWIEVHALLNSSEKQIFLSVGKAEKLLYPSDGGIC